MYENLIILLTCIKGYAKNIHYEVKGSSFYSKHLLADRVIEDNQEFIDDINEVLFLGVQKHPPLSEEIYKKAAGAMPLTTDNDQQNYTNLYELLVKTVNHLNFIIHQDISAAAGDLCGRIASDIQQMAGLVWKQAYPYMEENNIYFEIKEEGEEWTF